MSIFLTAVPCALMAALVDACREAVLLKRSTPLSLAR